MPRIEHRSRHQTAPQKSFAKLCLIYGGALGVIAGAGYGAFAGIESLRASSWEKELQAAQTVYQGASAVQARELKIAQKREEDGNSALTQLESRQEALEVLLGQSYPALKDSLADTAAKTKNRIVSDGRIEKNVENLIALRAKGLGDGPFIDQAKDLAQAAWPDGIEQQQKQTATFNGAPGVESEELGRLSRRLNDFVGQSDERLAILRKNVAEQAASFDMGRAEKTESEWLSVAQKEIQQESQQQLDSQINGYVNQVKVAANTAFENEGESMDSSDWDEIRTDFQNDPDWVAARQGLTASAQASAQSAVGIASDAMTAERESAVRLASQIAQDNSRADDLSIWQMALLMRWMSPSQSSLYIAADPWYFASNGYSLTGQPSYEWGARQAFRSSQGNPVGGQGWRYPSGQQSRAQNRPASASLAAQAARTGFTARASATAPVSDVNLSGNFRTSAGMATPNAVGRPSSSSINSNAMTQANVAQALGALPSNAKAAPGAYSPKAVGPAVVAPAGVGSAAAVYGTGLGSKMDTNAINRMASMSALMAAGNASKQVATSAADAAAQTAAARASTNAAGTAAQSAASLAAQSAGQKAAASSAQRAATGAADTAAKNAATTAASNAAQRAAGSAAQRAATTAAGKAADKAADSAAQRAASNAAQRAASSAASRAAQVAANRAAQSAANKAAQNASSKASQSASSKASQSASSRSSSRSSGSSRR